MIDSIAASATVTWKVSRTKSRPSYIKLISDEARTLCTFRIVLCMSTFSFIQGALRLIKSRVYLTMILYNDVCLLTPLSFCCLTVVYGSSGCPRRLCVCGVCASAIEVEGFHWEISGARTEVSRRCCRAQDEGEAFDGETKPSKGPRASVCSLITHCSCQLYMFDSCLTSYIKNCS